MGEDLCARIAAALEAAKAEMAGASDADIYRAMAVRAMTEAKDWLTQYGGGVFVRDSVMEVTNIEVE